MDENLVDLFPVRKLRGKDEYAVYKNYVDEISREKVAGLFEFVFNKALKVKDDQIALHWRKRGNDLYCQNDTEGAIKLYNKSLRYSTYNSQSYAVSLANKSAVLFTIEDYQNCLKDVDLCLRAKYPDCLKPKVYIRKAECYQKLGEPILMRKTLKKLSHFINESSELPATVKEKYANEIKNMTAAPVDAKNEPEMRFDEVPVVEPNPSFHNASPSVVLKYNKTSGLHVYAQKSIAVGEVVLIDKAYAFTPCYVNGKMKSKTNCQYCAKKTVHCVPCKSCVKHIYCTEVCRDSAWKEFHHWECKGIQSGFLPQMWVGYLALRVILKAAGKGLATVPIYYKEGVTDYIDKEDFYSDVFNLSNPFKKLSKFKVLHYVTTAALLVHYLNTKTNFFAHLKKCHMYADKDTKQLMNHVGGLIVHHLAQFHWNGIVIKDYDKMEPKEIDIALTVCPAMAFMNHSCDPNTAHYFVGDTVVVRAMRDIKAGEELCYPYMNTTYRQLGLEKRKELLEELCYLICKCSACMNPKMDRDKYNAYICIKCGGAAVSEVIVPVPWKKCVCLDCNNSYPLPPEIFHKEKLAVRYLGKFTAAHDLADVNATLKISKTIYKPSHAIYKVTFEELMQYYKLQSDIVNFIESAKMYNIYLVRVNSKTAHQNGYAYYNQCAAILELLTDVALNIGLEHLQNTRCRSARVVAKKAIAPGDILFVEKAYAFICYNDKETLTIHCQNCLEKAASCVPCKGCVEHLYCSEVCRDTAWNVFHQWECTILQTEFFSTNPLGPLALRVLFKGLQTGLSMKNIDFENEVINNGNIDDNYRYIYSLPTNIAQMTKKTLELIAGAAEFFVIFLKLKTNFFDHLKKWPAYANKSNEDLMNTIGGLLIKHIIQLHWSAIEIPIIKDGIPIKRVSVGIAVCPSLAMTTHCCKPNTTLYFQGDTLVVKALENIKPNEEVHHAYRGINHERLPIFEERQFRLLEECFLNCKCRVCANPKMTLEARDAYICAKCNGPLVLDWKIKCFDVGTCLDCNSESMISPEVAFKEISVLQNLAEFTEFDDLEAANQGLQLAKTIYQPYHSVISDFYKELAKYHLKTGNLKCHVEMQKVLTEHCDKYYGNLSFPSGAVRLTYCFIILKWLKDNLANRNLQVGEMLKELKNTISEVKVIMDLHFPPVLEKVAKLEKLILELQVLGFTQEAYNRHLDCFEYVTDYAKVLYL